MSDHDLDVGAARADLCRLLAACYYEPGPEFAEERVYESMQAAAARIGPEYASLARSLGDAFANEDPEALLIDYTRLFLGPVDAAAKPYGSVWLTGEATLMQPSSMAVLEIYRQGGFDLAEDFRELPDHVAAELEFLYLTLFRENAAERTADLDAVAATQALRRRFLAEHLGAWIDPFTRAMERAAQTDYYRALAPLTRRFVTAEIDNCR